MRKAVSLLLAFTFGATLPIADTVVDTGGHPCSITETTDGPVIAYGQGKLLKLARLVDGTWRTEAVAAGGGDWGYSGIDLAVSPDGMLAIATHTGYEGGVLTGAIRVHRQTGDGWTNETVDRFGSQPSLTWTPTGLAVAYSRSDSSGTHLKSATWDGAAWALRVIDSSNVYTLKYGWAYRKVYSPSIALSPAGRLAVSYGFYVSGYKRELRIAYQNADGSWYYRVLANDIARSTVLRYELGAVVAYVADSNSLNVLRFVNGAWLNERLPWSGGRIGPIDYDSDSLTAYDFAAGDLYLYSSGAPQRLASEGAVGLASGVYVDAAGARHIAYSNLTTGTLHYTRIDP